MNCKMNNEMNENNLLELVMIVKNSGDILEKVLNSVKPYISHYTILDTGSTDGTQDLIRRVMKGVKGGLYEEPFTNFRDSRNRSLDLSSGKCKYQIILDDSYLLQNGDKLIDFLRNKQKEPMIDKADSMSLYIQNEDGSVYCSNRIIKTLSNLRYIYPIHEVINPRNNFNVCIPLEICKLIDFKVKDHLDRTEKRKDWDIRMLEKEIKDNPTDPRNYYYLAQTYNFLEQYDKAVYYFKKRSGMKGFVQERYDALFEYCRLSQFYLKKSFEEILPFWEKLKEIDPERTESDYFIALSYYLQNNNEKAYEHFLKAYQIPIPYHTQYSIRPTINTFFIPRYLIPLCYSYKNYQLGLKLCNDFLALEENKKEVEDYNIILNWRNLFQQLLTFIPPKPTTNFVDFCFITKCSFNEFWEPSNPLQGGSETWLLEVSSYLSSLAFRVDVVANVKDKLVHNNVTYYPVDILSQYLSQSHINKTIIYRTNEYYPLLLEQVGIKDVYFILQDVLPSNLIIPDDDKLKKIVCMTDWHKTYFNKNFPSLQNKVVVCGNGIHNDIYDTKITKDENLFIYSSFPNRGLLPLLQKWKQIKEKKPNATLRLFCDFFENKWCLDNFPQEMKEIISLYDELKHWGVHNHGFVSKGELYKWMSRSTYWVYPNNWDETFCITAIEASICETLVVTTKRAGLGETAKFGLDWDENLYFLEISEKEKNEIIKNQKDYVVENYNWNTILEKLLYDVFEVCNPQNMLGFTHSLSQECLQNQKILKEFVCTPTQCLEIGCYTGSSTHWILQQNENNKVICIDRFENYDEGYITKNIKENGISQVFYKNMKRLKVEERVDLRKNDSTRELINLIKENQRFGLILIDGDHTLLKSYSDLILSWELLEKGGFILIDDYKFNLDKMNLLESPKIGVDRFIEDYKDEIDILHIGYRVILRKNN